LELRQRFGANFGAAMFLDAGRVSANLRAVPGEAVVMPAPGKSSVGVMAIPEGLRIGAGVGVRYYTPIGPIRLDVAVPVNANANDRKVPGYGSFQVYIGLGQAY
jgi:translocation and assembly module TamA